MQLPNITTNFIKSFFSHKSNLIFLIIFSSSFLPAFGEPILKDNQFQVEKYIEGLSWPTTISFVGNDILVLQKNDGKVFLIRDDILRNEPILDLNVHGLGETGLLGIVTVDEFVYLYFSESLEDGQEQIANRIYRFIWDGENLKEPILINEFPVSPLTTHVGGIMTSNSNGIIYAIIGDMSSSHFGLEGPTQNFPYGDLRDTGIIVIVGKNETVISPSKSANPFEHYYAVGIRNSFGLDIDPITNFLWDTENGKNDFDEINLVLPKFNSGWEQIQGPATMEEIQSLPNLDEFKYSDPEFSWEKPVAPTALTFVNSDSFEKYKNYLLVGDCVYGNIYKFKLNTARTDFVFDNIALTDKVFNIGDSSDEIIFGTDFGCITDIKFGPDGSLYVVSLTEGAIYKVLFTNEILEDGRKLLSSQEKFSPYANLENANLSFMNLTNVDLRFANLRYANLSAANLSNANLANADLSYADLSFADLSYTDLKQANFKKANLEKTKMIYSDAYGANFEGAVINNADLFGSNLRTANLQNVKMSGINFEKAVLRNADLSNSDLTNANLNHAEIKTANFTNSNLSGASLKGIDISSSITKNTKIDKTTEFSDCYENNFWNRAVSKVLSKLRDIDSDILNPFEWIFSNLCIRPNVL